MIIMNTKPPIQPNGSFYAPNFFNPFPRVAVPPLPNDTAFTSHSGFQPNQPFLQNEHNSAFYPANNVMTSSHVANQPPHPWRNFGAAWTYDHLAVYPYGAGYGSLDVRRKNATRESTSTLKAWLYEHIKNPYPTKSEKVMLAIITKMTLTQVSTWFANARRRLKKENKMQWSPRNRTGDDDDDDDDKNSDADDIAEGDTTRHRSLDDVLDDDDEDIVVDAGVDELPFLDASPAAATASSSAHKKSPESSGEVAGDGAKKREDCLTSASTATNPSQNNNNNNNHFYHFNQSRLHQSHAQHQLYFNQHNQLRTLPFSPFQSSPATRHPNVSLSNLHQSLAFLSKAAAARVKSSLNDNSEGGKEIKKPMADNFDENFHLLGKENERLTNAKPSQNSEKTKSSTSRTEDDEKPFPKISKDEGHDHAKPLSAAEDAEKKKKPRIWSLADVATSGNNKSKQTENDSQPSKLDYRVQPPLNHPIRHLNIHPAFVHFYHPYFRQSSTPRQAGQKSSLERSEAFDALGAFLNKTANTEDKFFKTENSGTFQPWLTYNASFPHSRQLQTQIQLNLQRSVSPPSPTTPETRQDNHRHRHDLSPSSSASSTPDLNVSRSRTSEAFSRAHPPSSSPRQKLPSDGGKKINDNFDRRERIDAGESESDAFVRSPPHLVQISPVQSSSSSLSSSSSSSSSLPPSPSTTSTSTTATTTQKQRAYAPITSSSAFLSSSSSSPFTASSLQPLSSSSAIISAPARSPPAYRKHSPSRDSIFEYWPSSRAAGKM